MDKLLNKKKILYLITKSYFGGAQRYVFELALAMQTSGHEVAVACGGNGELVSRLQAAGIKTFQVSPLERDIGFFKEIQALFFISNVIRSYQPDIVHLNSSKAGLLGSVAARLQRVPKIVFTAHGWPFLEPRKFPWRTMAWLGSYLTGLLAHQVILVSHNDKKHTYMPGVGNKISVIHTAVSNFTTLTRETARLQLLSAETIDNNSQNIWVVTHGEINHNKNLTTAIDAIAEFNSTHQTKICYFIIGEGELRKTIAEQVSLKGLDEYVYFLGYREEARQYLLAFDIYLIPSLKEGLPYSLLEAGISRLPCIASNVGGIPEVIIQNQTGLLINPENHMTIVESFDYLLTNSDKRSLYSTKLLEHIEENFSLPKMISATTKIYAL